MNPVPKPVRRPKKQRARLGARRRTRAETAARASRKAAKARLALPPPEVPKGTSHARRKRETGFMCFQREFGCDVRAAFAEEFPELAAAGLGPGFCPSGAWVEFMHLPLTVGRRRGPDKHGAGGCALGTEEGHHREIDGRIGGKGRWYVALVYEGQQRLRERLRSRSLARWEALSPEQQAEWDCRAASRSA